MTVKEIDGMPVLKWGTYALVERSNGVMVRRYMYEITAEDKPYPAWRECSYDEAIKALQNRQEVQAQDILIKQWFTASIEEDGTVCWVDHVVKYIPTNPNREWRTKK